VEAIRAACRKLETTDLTGCDLYTSCEPCSLCVATMLMAGIGRMYFGATLEQSGGIVPRGPLPPRPHLVRAQVGLPVEQRQMPAEQKLDGEAVAVLQAWVKCQAK
jgi:guanine deaminase